jgi:hypothetical protein
MTEMRVLDWILFDSDKGPSIGKDEGPIRRPERGSEWEPKKFFSKERTRPMPQIHNQGFPHEFAKVT